MNRTVFVSALVGAAAALLVGGTVAVATNMTFVLGAANHPDALTSVTAQNKDGKGGLNGAMIQLTNPSTAGAATALGLNVGAGRPPFTTNSSARVRYLNADQLDGIDSTGFVRSAGGGRVLTAQVFGPADQGGAVPVFDQSHGTPAFSVDYLCPNDLSSGGYARFLTLSTTAVADIHATQIVANAFPDEKVVRYASGAHADGLSEYTPSAGAAVTFNAAWYDGHMAQVWLYSYHVVDAPDPRDEGCYIQAMAQLK